MRRSRSHLSAPKIGQAKVEAAIEAARDQARGELGTDYQLVEVGAAATVEGLHEDLEADERLDAMIDKCVKRLLFVRGLKSMTPRNPSTALKQIKGPSPEK